jgi:hypothetical protein
MLGLVFSQVIDITGELIVQEGLCFFSAGFDKGEVGQRNDDFCCLAACSSPAASPKLRSSVESPSKRPSADSRKLRQWGFMGAPDGVSDIISLVITCSFLTGKTSLLPTSSRALPDQDIPGWPCAHFGGRWQPVVVGQPALTLRSAPLDFRIAAGSSLRTAIVQMKESGIEVNGFLLALLARVQRADTAIKAGSYAVNEGVTPHQLLDKLLKGKVTQGELILVEGWTFRQWRARLDRHPDLRHDTQG